MTVTSSDTDTDIRARQAMAAEETVDLAANLMPYPWRKKYSDLLIKITHEHINDPDAQDQLKRAIFYAFRFFDLNIRPKRSFRDVLDLKELILSHLEELQQPIAKLLPNETSSESLYSACRVARLVLKKVLPLFHAHGRAIQGKITHAVVNHSLKQADTIPVELVRSIQISSAPKNTRAQYYSFWRWQYISRNREYLTLLDQLKSLQKEAAFAAKIFQHPTLEYLIYLPMELVRPDRVVDVLKAHLIKIMNKLAENCLERFKIYPSWPLEDYTSETILERIKTGKFRCEERQQPKFDPFFTSLESNEQKAVECRDLLAKAKDDFFNSHTAEDIAEFYNAQLAAIDYSRKPYLQRIRIAHEPRAIGLWVWDRTNKEPCTSVRAAANRYLDLFHDKRDLRQIQTYHEWTNRCIEAGEVLSIKK